MGLLLRGLGGESILGLPAVIKYPYYSEEDGQLFPFRTLAMLCSFGTLVAVSKFSKVLFEAGHLPPHLDVFNCVVNIPEDIVKVQEPQEELTVLNSSECISLKVAYFGFGTNLVKPTRLVCVGVRFAFSFESRSGSVFLICLSLQAYMESKRTRPR